MRDSFPFRRSGGATGDIVYDVGDPGYLFGDALHYCAHQVVGQLVGRRSTGVGGAQRPQCADLTFAVQTGRFQIGQYRKVLGDFAVQTRLFHL